MAKTNREALREILPLGPDGPDLCEWSPLRKMPARLFGAFHGYAAVERVAVVDGEPCLVCETCAMQTSPRLLVKVGAGVPTPGPEEYRQKVFLAGDEYTAVHFADPESRRKRVASQMKYRESLRNDPEKFARWKKKQAGYQKAHRQRRAALESRR